MTHAHGEPDLGTTDPPALADPKVSSHAAHDPQSGAAGEHEVQAHLGPIDWAAYSAGVLGVLIGLGTALAFVVATNRLG